LTYEEKQDRGTVTYHALCYDAKDCCGISSIRLRFQRHSHGISQRHLSLEGDIKELLRLISHAPIAVFAYNRPEHIRRLLKSLSANPLVSESPVKIYCDGPKSPSHAESIAATRRAVADCAPAHAEVVERETNLGLARSIITGVTELCDSYGRVIVLEDDLLLSPHALGFLNQGLERYGQAERVMHVSAYMYPVRAALPAAFFYREATCWGWATWARAWEHFEPDAGKLLAEIDASGARARFNINETGYFYQMLQKQRDGEIDSWAIRWYASMFRRQGLALHPGQSFVQNHGFDGTGVHCNVDDRFEVAFARDPVRDFPTDIRESKVAVQAMCAYRQKSPFRAGLRRLAKRLVPRR
jgi:hypothetical protein